MKSITKHFPAFMASITIRNLDDSVKTRLRIAAARHGCSMEEEARRILRQSLMAESRPSQLGTRINQQFVQIGGVDLPIPGRSEPRSPPGFTDTEE